MHRIEMWKLQLPVVVERSSEFVDAFVDFVGLGSVLPTGELVLLPLESLFPASQLAKLGLELLYGRISEKLVEVIDIGLRRFRGMLIPGA
jgi:hypothetical protein